MRKIFIVLATVLLTASVFAQSPEKMSYQAVIRNASEKLVTDTQIGMQISILQGSATGIEVYAETHTATTNANGLVSIEIGEGSSNDDFSTIEWENGPFFIKTETDPDGGNSYSISGTVQLLSVPYALYAKNAGNGFSGNYSDLQNIPSNLISTDDTAENGDILFNNNGQWQLLSKGSDGQVLKLENGLPSWQQLSISSSPIPKATFIVSQLTASTSQTILVDASASTDDLDAAADLEVRWSWDNGISFTPWTTTKTESVQFETEGEKSILLEVRNSQDAISTASRTVIVDNQLHLPIVTTAFVTDITTNSVLGGGFIVTTGGANVTASGFCWATTPNPTIEDDFSDDVTASGVFVSNITDLINGTTYYIRAYATNESGTVYGNQKVFTTLTNIALPTVSTSIASNITQTSVTVGGNISNDGGSEILSGGICYSINQNPTITDNVTTDGGGVGAFSSLLDNLMPGTTYYARAYATNSAGTSYGNQISFSTGKELPIVSTRDIVSITAISAVSGGVISSTGGGTISAKGVCWSQSPNPTINDNHSTNGTGQSSFNSAVNILLPNTTYYVRAYATTEMGTVYGEEKSFTTLDAYIESFETSFVGSTNGWSVVNYDAVEGAFSLFADWTDKEATITRTLEADGQITFFAKKTGTGSITFYIDGELQGTYTSGEWGMQSFPVNAGERTFTWRSNFSGNGTVPTFWLDYIVMPK